MMNGAPPQILLRARAASGLLSMLILLVACGCTEAAAAGERLALVIGNSAYRHLAPLENPGRDALLMQKALEQAGFRVTVAIDVDLPQMQRQLLDFGRALRKPGVEAGLFYYAGHGIQVNGENYLVPISAEIADPDEVPIETVNANDFLNTMNSSDSRINIVILDACRNNPFPQSVRAATRGLARVDAPRGTVIAYATAPGNVAFDGSGGNSPYAVALSQAISKGRGQPIEAVFKAARRSVLAETDEKQVPWETSSITGDFYFYPPDASDAAPDSSPSVEPAPPVDDIIRAFDEAGRLDTKLAWLDFIERYGDRKSDPLVLKAADMLHRYDPPPEPAPSSPNLPKRGCRSVDFGVGAATLCATSILKPQSGNSYVVTNLTDDIPSTAWVEGASGDGLGEGVVASFDRPTRVSTIAIFNGYGKNASIFKKNNRVGDLEIRASNGFSKTIKLADRTGWQVIVSSDIGDVDWISLTIDSVYRGTAYRDTAISGLRID